MTINKEPKYERMSTDSQFYWWNIPKISIDKKVNLTGKRRNSKPPFPLTDVFLEGINFPNTASPLKMRSLHLSTKQTKILATLLPDAVIDITDLSKENIDSFVGVLLFADISGFTALCEKYNGFGKSGSDKLTATLNSYLGAMVEVIYKYDGDVLKFAGDAILALWKLAKNEYLYNLIHRVIRCALYIQNSMGVYETDVKVLLKVKLAISAGNMTFSIIGNDNSRHYLIVGSPVYEIKTAERICSSGEVILSFSAWGHLSSVNYEYMWKDDEHVKIIRIIYDPEDAKREILRPDGISINKVRSMVDEAIKRDLSSELRTFVIPSVIQQIDADLPMEYLSEMRSVTVLFINIVPNELHTKSLIDMVDKAYIIICSLVYKAMGSVNKVSLFDKDVMVLAIFGLRGFNHEEEVSSCLKCAYDIIQACCSLEGVSSTSAGVTTGLAYCGVVGHPLRREYTVIGAVVNKAARLMCAYPGKVVCDRDTFVLSNLASRYFTIQEKKFLKGIDDAGPVYEFTREQRKTTLSAMHEGIYPLLGRYEEFTKFLSILQSFSDEKSWERALLIRGPPRIGKSRLLDEMIMEALKRGFSPIAIVLHNFHSTMAYGTVQCIIKKILELPDSASVEEKEQKLQILLRNHVSKTEYWYLNEVMNVKFVQSSKENISVDASAKFEKIRMIFHIILTVGTTSKIIAIDDMEYCDELSWKLIMSVIHNRVKFIIMTMAKRLKPESDRYLIIPPEVEPYIVKMNLTGLTADCLATLACQILNAKAIPVELERILVTKSNGNPGWCESFLISLTQSNVIRVIEVPVWHIKNLKMIIPPEIKLHRTFSGIKDVENRTSELIDEDISLWTENKLDREKSADKLRGKAANKMNFLKFRRVKGSINASEDSQYKKGVNVEHAYEELMQRIQQVRMQPKTDTKLASPSDVLSVVTELEGEKKAGEDPFVDNHLAAGREIIQGVAENIGMVSKTEESDSSDESEEEEELKLIKSNIQRRLSLKTNPQISEKRRQYLDTEIVMKSMEDIREEVEVSSHSLSRSAENFINRGEIFTQNSTDDWDAWYLALHENDEYPPSALWKSPTETLLQESIKIFAERRKLREKNMNQPGTHPPTVSDTFFSSKLEVGFSDNFEAQNKNFESNKVSDFKQPETNVMKSKDNIENERMTIVHQDAVEGSSNDVSQNVRRSTEIQSRFAKSLFNTNEKSKNQNNANSEQKRRRWWMKFTKRKRSSFGSSPSVVSLGFPHENEHNNDTLPAVLINPSVNLEEVTTPECFVGIIMTAFDCLRPYEQLMLKCGSILGEKFTRKMLNAIMHNPNPFLTAEAVKRLFEMRILCCGSEPSDLSQTTSSSCVCMCTLTENSRIDDSLPKYSYCELLVFKYAMFRSTLYELIPQDQKREFHIRAVEFLEKEQIFCSSCMRMNQSRPTRVIFHVDLKDGRRASSVSEGSKLEIKIIKDYFSSNKKKPTKADNTSSLFLPSVIPSFQKCECLSLQADTYKQLINHSIAAGLKKKECQFIISYCSIMITLGEFEEAEQLLTDMESNFKNLLNDETKGKKAEKKLLIGRLHLLLGQLYLETGSLKKANAYLIKALNNFGARYMTLMPTGTFEYMYEYITQLLQQSNTFFCRRTKYSESGDFIAICLSLLSNAFMIQDKWLIARTLALRSLNYHRGVNKNCVELCNAYSNVIDIYRRFGNFKFCRKLELAASKSCISTFHYRTELEMIAIGRLSCSILNARSISGYLWAASKLGESALKISRSVSFHKVEYYITSEVVQLMMMIGKIKKAADLILHLPQHELWYYILCLEFAMETGFAIANTELCTDFISNAINSNRSLEHEVRDRAMSVVYVWLSRLGKQEEAELWHKILPQSPAIPHSGDTMNQMITIMKILEGELINLRATATQDIKQNPINRKVTYMMKVLEKTTRKTEIMQPRLLHLRAYYQLKLRNMSKAFELLHKARKICLQQGNLLERSWISHSRDIWRNEHDFNADYWTDSAKRGKLLKWSEIHTQINWKNYMYSLK